MIQPSTPPSLRALLEADAAEVEERWAAFLAEFTPVVLRALQSLGSRDDAIMDRYDFLLGALRRDGFRRLRSYQPLEGASFASWLTVVARRLGLDHHRHAYGRPQTDTPGAAVQHQLRRQLLDLVGDELALGAVTAPPEDGPDQVLEATELSEALAGALSALRVEDRLILRLRFEDGASVPEIAKVLQEPSPFRMYRRIDRILAQLRETLSNGGHGPEPLAAPTLQRKLDPPHPF